MNAVLPLEQTDPELAEHIRLIAQRKHPAVKAVEVTWQERRYHRHDGSIAVSRSPLPGRNDPCGCGSGKKFKKCCGSPFRKT